MTAENRREFSRWSLSGAIVLAAHAGAVAYVMARTDRISPAEPPAAIVIDLAPVAASPAAQEMELPPGPPQPPSDEAPDKPVDEVAEEETAPEPEPEPIPEPLPDVEEQPIPSDPVEEPPPPATPPVPEPEVPLPPPPPPPEKKPATVVEPEPVKRAPPKKKPPRKPSVASAPRPMPVPAAKSTAPVSAASKRPSNAVPNWRSLLAGILERNKRYPSAARSRGDRGVASVRFSLNRSGALVGLSLVRSSGSGALDEEAVALVRRSQPFPPPPSELRGTTVTIVVPVRFSIR